MGRLHLGLTASLVDAQAIARARVSLAKAYAARAEHARHGAGQISLSAQRAPTEEACESGWRRAEEIAEGAARSAEAAERIAEDLERDAPTSAASRAARAAAQRARAAAEAARALIEARNHAYTFHADGGFSFGEGWHLAAAAVLAGAAVQIEPGKAASEEAERFLRDAGVGGRLQPYRSRPRAMKQTTEIVARAFLADQASAQRRLRAAFLGDAAASPRVRAYADERLAGASPRQRKVVLWIRDGAHAPHRNTTSAELEALCRRAATERLVPVLVGDAAIEGRVPAGAVDMTLHWTSPLFRGVGGRRAQLHLFEDLRERHGLVGQIGVTTAGMDGPALMGLPTIYLTDAPNVRMRQWVGVVPGYEEIVRDRSTDERVASALRRWSERRS